VLTHVHHVEDLMEERFPVPVSVGRPLPMTLIDGDDEIPFLLHRQGSPWKLNMWKLRKIMDPARLHEWRFHHVHFFAARAAEVTRALKNAAERGVTLYDRP